jgi:hypothetical protein
MFPANYFGPRYWAPRFWAKLGNQIDRFGMGFILRSVMILQKKLPAVLVKTFKLKAMGS